MKTSTLLILVGAGFALIVWAFSKGLISSGAVPISAAGQPKPGTIVAPQPAQNYGGFLAASTASGVSSVLNTAISGLNNLFTGWFGKSSGSTPVAQGSNPSSPSLFAQPGQTLQQLTNLQTANQNYIASLEPSTYSNPGSTLIGPQIDPSLAFTSDGSFDYAGLAADNAFDPEYSLEEAV